MSPEFIPTPTDKAWDIFLEGTHLGQFQQSARWAKVKALDGWNVHRLFVDNFEVAAGGLQLLWKRSRLGRIGYVSKGPVLATEDPATVSRVFRQLQDTARRLGLRALILQPPDASTILPAVLVRHGFQPQPLSSVIRATAVLNLAGGKAAVISRMNRQVRRETRIAAKEGITIRWGERSDLPDFFALMLESSRRQRSSPNPNRIELLEALWDQFWPNARLGLACLSSKVVAGLLLVAHGHRMTFWKKGWNSEYTRSFANCLLNVEAIGWTCNEGFQDVDFVGMSPTLASSLLAGKKLNVEQRRGRDLFNLRFGAQPRLLPPAQLFVTSLFLRRLFDWATRFDTPARGWVMQRMGGG